MKEHKHLGIYALVLKDNQILLIKKAVGPYEGKLDLPGGSAEFGETPEETLKRELKEETGLDIYAYELFDANSVTVDWYTKEDEITKVHHTGIFYKVTNYQNEIQKDIEIDSVNDDSLGAEFYDINSLKKDKLSAIAIIQLEKLGYDLK